MIVLATLAALHACADYSLGEFPSDSSLGEDATTSDAPASSSDSGRPPSESGSPSEGGNPTDAAPAVPGTVSVSISNLGGAFGKILMARIFPRGVTFGTSLGGICMEVFADPFSINSPLLKASVNSGDPCALASGAGLFAPGDYDLSITVNSKNSGKPEKCATVPFSVNGNVSFVVPTALASCM